MNEDQMFSAAMEEKIVTALGRQALELLRLQVMLEMAQRQPQEQENKKAPND